MEEARGRGEAGRGGEGEIQFRKSGIYWSTRKILKTKKCKTGTGFFFVLFEYEFYYNSVTLTLVGKARMRREGKGGWM